MQPREDRSAVDQDEKPERVQAQHKAEKLWRHIKREVKRIRYETPRREDFTERLQRLIQQGG